MAIASMPASWSSEHQEKTDVACVTSFAAGNHFYRASLHVEDQINFAASFSKRFNINSKTRHRFNLQDLTR
jgi:hypothetical protein